MEIDDDAKEIVREIGSAINESVENSKQVADAIERLREAGISDEQLRNIHAPIGLDIGAVTPEEVALAILAEIVAERRGATGTSLSAWRRKIS